ncbi:unnamed protein product [Lactuca virosa]|uniref:Uncharacterized protein n=1 Tax=Lactuca virosa TaxID=75947 RepID=A0AAU9M1C5_9ASTR|nr:unnamed protein product [Lactuca virosa]
MTNKALNTNALKKLLAMDGWNKSTLIGEAISLHHLVEIQKLLEVEVNFLNGEHNWSKWFNWLRMSILEEHNLERIAWIKNPGVPIFLRAKENYTSTANTFGKTLQVEGNNWVHLDLLYGIACILTTTNTPINREATCS